jgi:nitrogenase molybdenum-iron protein NifN
MLELMGCEYTLIPDYSFTLDQPGGERYQKIPWGGNRPEEIARMPGAPLTIQFGETCPDEFSPGFWLQREYEVPLINLPLPIGIEATDRFLHTLQKISGRGLPERLGLERGWLLDGMADAHRYNAEGRAVVYGEPELVYAMVRLCTENGILPAVIASGSGNSRLTTCIEPLVTDLDEQPILLEETDFAEIETAVCSTGVNIAIGHSGGKFFTERYDIPVVRIGFPVHDRIGGQRILSMGYAGSLAFLDRLTNSLLERKYATYRKRIREQMGIVEGI